MRLSRAWIGLFLVLLLSACSTSKPFTYEYGYKPTDFSALKTYRWAPDKKRRVIPEIAENFVKSTNEELQKKGFVLKKDGDVDFIMSFDITAKSNIDVNTYQIFGGTGIGFNWRRNTGFQKDPMKVSGTGRTAKMVGQGTLILDAVTPGENSVFWRAIATKEIKIDGDLDSMDRMVNVAEQTKGARRAAKQMLSQFPPQEQ